MNSSYGALRKAAGPTIPDRGIEDGVEFAERVRVVYAEKCKRFPHATAGAGYKLGLEQRIGRIMRGEEDCDHSNERGLIATLYGEARCVDCGAEA